MRERRWATAWRFDEEHELILIHNRDSRQRNLKIPELISCRWSKNKRMNEMKVEDKFYKEFKQG